MPVFPDVGCHNQSDHSLNESIHLDNCMTGLDTAFLFQLFDHSLSDAILHGPTGIKELAFHD